MNKLAEKIPFVQLKQEDMELNKKCFNNIKKIIDRIEAELKIGWQIEDRLLLQKI